MAVKQRTKIIRALYELIKEFDLVNDSDFYLTKHEWDDFVNLRNIEWKWAFKRALFNLYGIKLHVYSNEAQLLKRQRRVEYITIKIIKLYKEKKYSKGNIALRCGVSSEYVSEVIFNYISNLNKHREVEKPPVVYEAREPAFHDEMRYGTPSYNYEDVKKEDNRYVPKVRYYENKRTIFRSSPTQD
jgi:hypothetical protein